jgi:hypothetical protein
VLQAAELYTRLSLINQQNHLFKSTFMLQRLFLCTLLSLFLLSCLPKYDPDRRPPRKVWGYKPVFSTDTSLLRVMADTARPVKWAGKIYAMNHLILQNELGEGIHVFDNANPAAIRNMGFIRLKGNSEMSIKGSFLYANSFTDLVIVDISNWRYPKEVRRLKNAFQQGGSVSGSYMFIPPPERNVYYECTGFGTGIQTGWEKDSILENNCFYR